MTGACTAGTSFAIVRRSFALFLLSRTGNRRYRSPSQVHAQTVFTMAPPPWHVTTGTGNGMPIDPPSASNLKSSSYWRGTFRSWPSITEGNPPSNRHSRAAKRPLAASLPATRALGHRRLLDRFRVSAGLRTTLRCFQLLTGKKRIQLRLSSNSDACSRSPNSSRVKFLEHCFGGTLTTVNPSASHLRAGSHRMSWTTERGQARKHPNSETSPARWSAGSLRTPRNKSTVDTAAALLEGNFTRPRRHRADITNIELVGLLTILQNQTIFEIFIPTTSIENLDPVLRHPISL